MKAFSPSFFYHFVEPANLASIKRHGLLSTERLLEMSGLNKKEKHAFLETHRPGSVTLKSGIVIRGQEPMPPNVLAPALRDGMTPADWYRLLNGFVFLWTNQERVDRHQLAFKGRPQKLLVFDAKLLLENLSRDLYVSPINSGNAMRKAAPRSSKLFVPYHVWLKRGWAEIGGFKRAASSLPAEVIAKGHLPLEPYLIRIESM